MDIVTPIAPEMSAGVDWLTCTAQHPHRVAGLLSFGRDVLEQEKGAGGLARAWHWQGFSGWTAGGAGYGFNGSRAIVRLSGATARESAADAISLSDNVSRLDVQVTVRPDGSRNDLAKHLYESFPGSGGRRGRPISRSLIQTNYGGDSLYIGRRISDSYGRIYNKSAEEREKTDRPRWRYEVEFKRKVAAAQAQAFSKAANKDTWVVGRVYHWFTDRHCSPPISPVASPTERGNARGDSAQARRIQWLRRGVKPVVQQLALEYGWPDVLSLLGVPMRVSDTYINEVINEEDH